MNRTVITELFVRLYAIWLIIAALHGIPQIYINSPDLGKLIWIPIIGLIVIAIIAIMMIVFSKGITKIIWLGRNANDEVVVDRNQK
jgi:hypothetical protein